jgi:hypothetical protein
MQNSGARSQNSESPDFLSSWVFELPEKNGHPLGAGEKTGGRMHAGFALQGLRLQRGFLFQMAIISVEP